MNWTKSVIRRRWWSELHVWLCPSSCIREIGQYSLVFRTEVAVFLAKLPKLRTSYTQTSQLVKLPVLCMHSENEFLDQMIFWSWIIWKWILRSGSQCKRTLIKMKCVRIDVCAKPIVNVYRIGSTNIEPVYKFAVKDFLKMAPFMYGIPFHSIPFLQCSTLLWNLTHFWQ